jgi:hypothetical protein
MLESLRLRRAVNTLRKRPVKLFTDSANLTLARDLANGSKHMTTTGYDDDGSASVARAYAGNGRIPYVVPRPVGRRRQPRSAFLC